MKTKRTSTAKQIKILTAFLLVFAAVMTAVSCGKEEKQNTATAYEQITQKQAKHLMDTEKDLIILDVRTESEYREGHIAGAVLIPDYEIEKLAEKKIENKDRLILVYCRSGRRSKLASQKLAGLGYTNVKEFGGINTWSYGTVNE